MENTKPLRYRVAVEWSDEDGAYVARVPALPGCAAHGDTADEAVKSVLEAAEGLLALMREDGDRIPPEDASGSYSGNIRLRLPRSLHQKLDEQAAADGVSLNTLMVSLLSEGVGERRAATRRAFGDTEAELASCSASEPPERASVVDLRQWDARRELNQQLLALTRSIGAPTPGTRRCSTVPSVWTHDAFRDFMVRAASPLAPRSIFFSSCKSSAPAVAYDSLMCLIIDTSALFTLVTELRDAEHGQIGYSHEPRSFTEFLRGEPFRGK